jgi:anthranilate phosphoribosyltransferase
VSLTDPSMAPAMTGALLAALRIKGATAPEVRGFARAMRSLARRPGIAEGEPVADVVGTGGDGSQSLNLSTGAALLAAACGVRIAKHGNRSVSLALRQRRRAGSSRPPAAARRARGRACLERNGFTFLFAPHYHPAMKAIAPVRAALGVRTIFNLLGPLSNPAQAPYALIGAFSLDVARLMADTLAGMPIARMFVVCGDTGWDEPTPAAPFTALRRQARLGDAVAPHCRRLRVVPRARPTCSSGATLRITRDVWRRCCAVQSAVGIAMRSSWVRRSSAR